VRTCARRVNAQELPAVPCDIQQPASHLSLARFLSQHGGFNVVGAIIQNDVDAMQTMQNAVAQSDGQSGTRYMGHPLNGSEQMRTHSRRNDALPRNSTTESRLVATLIQMKQQYCTSKVDVSQIEN